MRLIQRGVYWYVRFDVVIGGKTVDKRISTEVAVGIDKKKTKEEARVAGMQIVRRFFNETAGVEKDPAFLQKSASLMTLKEALARVWQDTWSKGASEVTLKYVVPVLQRDIGYWLVNEITTKRLKEYCRGLLRPKDEGGIGLTNATVNRRMSAVSKALHVCVEEGELVVVPPIPRFREDDAPERYLSFEEEQRLLEWFTRMGADDEIDKRPQWEYLHNLTIFLLDTGFRFSEVAKCDIENGLAILWIGTTKNRKARRIPLTKRAQAAASALKGHPLHSEEFGFHWPWASYRFDRAVDTLKIEEVTMHTLRHTCASRLVQRGVDLYVVKEWLGHKSIRTTERYAHLAPGNFTGAVAALERKPRAVATASPLEASEAQQTGSFNAKNA